MAEREREEREGERDLPKTFPCLSEARACATGKRTNGWANEEEEKEERERREGAA